MIPDHSSPGGPLLMICLQSLLQGTTGMLVLSKSAPPLEAYDLIFDRSYCHQGHMVEQVDANQTDCDVADLKLELDIGHKI